MIHVLRSTTYKKLLITKTNSFSVIIERKKKSINQYESTIV